MVKIKKYIFVVMNKLRKILFPFSIAYDGVTYLRNWLFDNNYLEQTVFDVPIICVGNLNLGGTGKSPMIEYLIGILKDDFKVAVLSRGYQRKTIGFQLVDVNNDVLEVGDEPLQFKLKFPDIVVAVDANRRRGINKLKDIADVILLDDAFQHRKVKPFFSVLLTSFSNLYINDLVLPAGNLRESKTGAKRADCVVVTKCPENLPYSKQQQIQFDLKLEPNQQVYFSSISYASLIQGIEQSKHVEYLEEKEFVLVTGIANPAPLVDYLKNLNLSFKHFKYGDHHNFSTQELLKLDQEKYILTTEKDFMRLKSHIKKAELYYLPISLSFLNKEDGFIKRIQNAAAGISEKQSENF
ncbi:tetraacyldisaccharide 4'-kinase [uncultured Planktosalinus sp.]|uniref:tetraacyldisaccharide 4'-kinase n=1 Tax=uncultured Planktosalinus sp. TaxID=1810935 RepID=UPI0030D82944